MTASIVALAMVFTGAALAQTPLPNRKLDLKLSMISLGVTDSARSLKFYRDTLGFELVSEPEPGQVAIVRAGNMTITLNRPLGLASQQLAGAVEIIFTVTGVRATYQTLAERGCHFVQTPREIFSGTWAATFTDPDGHLLTVMGPQ